MYYVKKPIPVMAVKIPEDFNQDTWLRDDAPQWLVDAFVTGKIENNNRHLVINTLEGPMICKYGYWIIRGVRGELYGCRADIFEDTYESYKGE